MPESNYVVIEGLRCPICGVLNVQETAVWRMGSQNVRQLVCLHGHTFRDYERNGVHHPIVYARHSALGETTTETTISEIPSEITGRWAFAEAPTISLTDFDRFCKFLKAGLELELNYKNGEYNTINDATKQYFRMPILEYHHDPYCPVCGQDGCWEHIPPKLVRAIQKDGSINGNEFLIYGSSEPSEEFAEQIKPTLEFLSQHYKVTESDSAHVHLLITDDYIPLPLTIANNFWQLMRFFYPGYAWIFGNTPGSFLRRSHYSGFQDLLESPLFDHVGGTRNAVYFWDSRIHDGVSILY